MERDTLEEILAVEGEIRAQLELARDEAARWLAGVRDDVDRQKLAELARLEEAAAREEAAAPGTARAAAAGMVQRAEETARRIERLADVDLLPRVRAAIACILPREVA